MKKISFWGNRLFRRSVQLFGSVFYVNPPPDLNRSIFVVGTARSGTTWLGDIIASQISCRSMFEPFDPDLVIAYRQFNYFQYMRPGKTDDQFYNFARKIFTGNIRNNWIDHQNERIFPKYRLIKEIRANLSLKWLHDQFPQVPKFLLIRHPCSVVQSRLSLNWATDLDIQHFLSQPDLIEDHLSTYLDVINGAKTDCEKHAIIWCISNLVPLKQFSRGQIPIIFYENMLIKPDIELPRIFATIHHEYKNDIQNKMMRPSQTAKVFSPVATGKNPITAWKSQLCSNQVEEILKIVKSFGLEYLYVDSTVPADNDLL